jgi:hypothetical protein
VARGSEVSVQGDHGEAEHQGRASSRENYSPHGSQEAKKRDGGSQSPNLLFKETPQ